MQRTLVFDEIDTGIGGGVAEAVGRRLKKLSASNQVLCVTHLAQVAGFADHHYSVEKREVKGRTVAEVEELTGDGADAGDRAHAVGPAGDAGSSEACRAVDSFGRGQPMSQSPIGAQGLRLRSAEWLLVIYFGYVAADCPAISAGAARMLAAIRWSELLVCALFLALAYGESREHAELFSMSRDWAPGGAASAGVSRDGLVLFHCRAISIWNCAGWSGTGRFSINGGFAARDRGAGRGGAAVIWSFAMRWCMR